MKISKDDIQFIDDYLKKRGIKYWDVRLEMIDHLVSDIESYKGSADFKTLFNQSLKNANWDKNLKDVHTQSWKSTNTIYRAKHAKEMFVILKNPIYLLCFFVFYLALNWLATSHPNSLKPIAFTIFFLPITVMLFEAIKSLVKKLGKSVNMQYGLFYFSFGMIMMNLPLQLLPKEQLSIWLPLILSIYLLMTFAGYRVYRYALKKVLLMKNAVQ